MSKPVEIEVFRVGTHTSSEGTTLDFPAELVDEAIEGYDPSKFRAPLIVSHETGGYSDKDIVKSELAFGVADSFYRVGQKVFARFKKIAPEFRRWVEEGRLHSVSSSFYLPDSPNNPTPGKLAFRHIAALGTNPPAVKGMAPLELQEFACFSDGGVGTVSFSLPIGEPFGIISRLFRGLRDRFIDEKDLETAEALMPSEAILALENMASVRYVSSDLVSAQMQEIWQCISQIREELSRCLKTENEPLTPYQIYKETPVTQKHSKAMAGVVAKDASMGNLADFMKALDMPKEEESLARSYMDGSVEMPADKKKKLAAALGMTDQEFERIYKSDEEMSMSEQIAFLEQATLLAELKEQNERLQRELIEQRAERRKAEITSFLESEKRSGRVTPGMIRPQTVEFSGKTETYDLVSFMCSLNDGQLAYVKKLLSSLPTQVTYSEVSTVEDDVKPGTSLSFAEVGEMARQKMRAARAAGQELTEAQAVDQVMAEHGIRY